MSKIYTSFKKFNENVDLNNLTDRELNEILEGYLDAVIFTEEERIEEECGDEECDMRIENVEEESKSKSLQDIKKFIDSCLVGVKEVITKKGYAQLGHDIHLSRNGHGAGFFDRDYEFKDELQKCAESLGETYVFYENGKIYIE